MVANPTTLEDLDDSDLDKLDGVGGVSSPLASLARKIALGAMIKDIRTRLQDLETEIGSAGALTVDTIGEETAGAGVTIDSLKIKDSGIDASGLATGVGYLGLGDNLAAAWTIKQGSTSYVTFVTSDGVEEVDFAQRLTTTDGVSGGTARVVGGRANSDVTGATVTNSVNTIQALGAGYSIPANTLKAGVKVEIYCHYEVTASASTDTLLFTLKFGGVTVQATAAIDTAANDKGWMRFEFMVGTAGAGGKIFGSGTYIDPAGTTVKTFHTANGGTSVDTTGALVVQPYATWSATTATNTVKLDGFVVRVE